MKTKIQNLFIALPVLLLLLPGVVQAQDAYSTNADGSIYTYSTNADGSANIVAYAGPPWVVTIPTNINGLTVTSIGTNAFENDTSLTNVTIPGSVTSIGADAFYGCTCLTNATIGSGVTSIGYLAFYNCNSLTSVMIPGNVTSIGAQAFFNCLSLNSVTIPDSVTSIGERAFELTSLTSVTIPSSVTNIGYLAFATSLTAITVDTNNLAYSSLNGVLFDKSQATLIEYPGGLGGSYTIPNSVTSIGEGAFTYTRLTSITIPGSVTSIGDSAFVSCTSLTSVTIGNGVTSIGVGAFLGCIRLTNVTIPGSVTSIGQQAFENCSSLTSVTLPNSVTSIGYYAFAYCISLTSVTIPGSVTSIGQQAFYYCTNLTSVTIPASVTSIGYEAFFDCFNLTGVYFWGNAPPYDGNVFYGDSAIVYYLPGTTGWGAMFDGLSTAPWFLPNPVILNNGPSFGVQPGGFGFTISWATNASVVVEAATNLANPVWIPVSTATLTDGTNYFSDPQWTNYPERFYRVTSAFTVGGTLTGLPAGDTVTLQDNGSDNLTLSTNGPFTFPTALPNGHAYSVTVSGTSGGTETTRTLMNGSGTISGTNVTNVAVLCPPLYTGNLGVDMYNAAVADGTAHGGVPGVMVTENGGPFRVTALGSYSHAVCLRYAGYQGGCTMTTIVGTTSCSSTTFPVGTLVIQFGIGLACGPDEIYGY